MAESRVLARLQRETRMCHPAADADRMAVMTATASPGSYRGFLVRIHGFEAPVESAIAATPELAASLDVTRRARVPRLRADLQALGVPDPGSYPRCDVAKFAGPAAALGWLYVIERNMFVHGLVERYLRQRLPRPLRLAGSYLSEQLTTSDAAWRDLGAAMDRLATDAISEDRIVYAARLAFRTQRSWYQHAPHPAAEQPAGW